MKTDRIFVLMLVILLPMSGCFENSVGDAEGQVEPGNSEDSMIDNASMNQLPLLYLWSDDASYTTNDRTEIRWNWQISVSDLDGNISEVGVDSDLDGFIDYQFVSNDWSVHAQEFEGPSNLSTSDFTYRTQNLEWCYFAFNLIVIDDDGGKYVEPYTSKINCN